MVLTVPMVGQSVSQSVIQSVRVAVLAFGLIKYGQLLETPTGKYIIQRIIPPLDTDYNNSALRSDAEVKLAFQTSIEHEI